MIGMGNHVDIWRSQCQGVFDTGLTVSILRKLLEMSYFHVNVLAHFDTLSVYIGSSPVFDGRLQRREL